MPTLFIDNLTVIDCSILDPSRGLIGASWSVDVELTGDLDKQSMVFDFSKVKKTIKHLIDEEVDHKLLIPLKYEGLKSKDQQLMFALENGDWISHKSPSTAVCGINCKKVNKRQISKFLKKRLLAALPDNVKKLRISLRKEDSLGHYYTYSHGLKKHDGNCQRIAHGHRSTIKIKKNGRRSRKHEKQIAKLWSDIYIGTNEDVKTLKGGRVEFAYESEQGQFNLNLSEDRVHLMNRDSTIECIADHVLKLLEQDSQEKFKVYAFEGIGKGAIAESD